MDASPPCRAVRMVARHLNLSLNLIPVNFMAGEHMTPQFRKYPVIFGGPHPDSDQEKPLVRALDLLGGFLGENKFLSGDDVTLADISILASLTCADYDLGRFPVILDYYERLKSSLPYYNEINDLGIQQMRGIRNQNNSK
ncbi:hypothetical protein HPB52_012359 [Rhipicephalus sanguineus]|uniref:Glutathione S-transferase n=1 Tax=Rhipicephalus sanguineus TaxID=34632 RepID=A0A9D4PW42_RHISA|nr:hypothetical protein HPB52_012359 [Rhipicephalus sanguineus]